MKLSIFVALALFIASAVQIAEAQPREVCGYNGCPPERRGGHYDDRRPDDWRRDGHDRRGATFFGGSVEFGFRIGPPPRRGRTVVVVPSPPRVTVFCETRRVFDYGRSGYVLREVCREVRRR